MTLRKFARAREANVAILFALSLVPMAIAAGAGVDVSRALIVRGRLAEALDAAGLAVGAAQGLTTSEQDALAQHYFDANFTAGPSYGTPAPLTVSRGTNTISLSTSLQMPTTLMSVAGVKTMDVSYTSQVVWGQTKLWVALVLDNTGSMCEPDSIPCSGDTNPNIKINALKAASHQLLNMLQNASANPGDVKVSIVPFAKDVNIGTANKDASWLDWTSWDASNGSCYGANTWGWVRNKSQCLYYGGTWTPASHSYWTGCVTDRNQDYDTMNTTPSDTATDFVPEQYSYCPEQLLPLGYDWSALSNEIDGMQPNGGTNQTIGLAWGWQSLTDGDPMNSGPLPDQTRRVIILLSDGLNTQDRWYGNGSYHNTQVDARMKLACDNAKADGVTIYTVFVDLGGTQGSSAVLQYCASDASKYFDLTTSGQIVTAFNTIGQQITNLRVAK